MTWTNGNISGSPTLTDDDDLYALHINELRTAVDLRALDSNVVHLTGTQSVAGAKTFTSQMTLANSAKVTALILNNAATTGPEALGNEILFKPQNLTYSYGIISWYCDDYTRKDVIMQAHRQEFDDSLPLHRHWSLYTSNFARSSTVKRVNIPYGKDIANWTFENSTLEIQGFGATSDPYVHVNNTYSSASADNNLLKLTNGPTFPSTGEVAALVQYGTAAMVSLVHQAASTSLAANIDSTGKYGFAHQVTAGGGYGLSLTTNGFNGVSSSNGLARFAHLTAGDTGNVVNIDNRSDGKSIYVQNNGTELFSISSTGVVAIVDGLTAPSATAGLAKIYVDTADGDLKVKFGDGTTKTIVVDT